MLEDVKKRVGKNRVFMDVGENIGNHTVCLVKICQARKVYSFEYLKQNIEINKLNDVVEIFKYAIGSGNIP